MFANISKIVKTNMLWPVGLALALSLAYLAYLAYAPGLTGTFVLDDYNNFVLNKHLHLQNLSPASLKQAAMSGGSGPLGRPISMASFALNIYATGLNPVYFKLTNIAIHLLNGIGVFFLTLLILWAYRKRYECSLSDVHSRWVSFAVASAWLVHPLNLTSVLYVVQRMNSLAALFTFAGLILYVWGRERIDKGAPGKAAIFLALIVCTPLAALSKENGALLPALMLVLEISLFKFSTDKKASQVFLYVLFGLGVLLPIAVAFVLLLLHPEILTSGYKIKGLTIAERLMTECRVIWIYIQQILVPNAGKMGLYQDDILLSKNLVAPATTIPAILGIIGLLLISFLGRNKFPILTFGILFFLTAHGLESTLIPLEIAFEHRNYLPMYGLLFAFFFYLLHPLKFKRRYIKLRRFSALILIGLMAFETHTRAESWSNPFDLAKYEVEHHPNSVRANIDMADLYDRIVAKTDQGKEANYQLAKYFYERSITLDKNNSYALLSLIILNSFHNQPIDSVWISNLKIQLATQPQPPVINTKLLFLVRCQESGVCKLTSRDIEEILKAPLMNNKLTSLIQGEVRYIWAVYLINLKHDYPAAKKVLFDMVKVSGDPQHRLNLTKILVAFDDTDDAQKQIRILEKNHLFPVDVAAQKKLLESKSHPALSD